MMVSLRSPDQAPSFLAGSRQSPTIDSADHPPGSPAAVPTQWKAQAPSGSTLTLCHRRWSDPLASSSTATARSPESLPRSRSRGGSGAGSSGQPGRRNPRAANRVADVDVADFLAAARAALTAQRAFRVEQLQQLDAFSPNLVTDPTRAEVHRALRTAARSALRDIEFALRRISQGGYGLCSRCGDTMTGYRLRALPMAPLCETCHRVAAARVGTEPSQPSPRGRERGRARGSSRS